jgi:hypothetical protein
MEIASQGFECVISSTHGIDSVIAIRHDNSCESAAAASNREISYTQPEAEAMSDLLVPARSNVSLNALVTDGR